MMMGLMMQRKVTEIFYDTEEDWFGYTGVKLDDYPIDDLYRISAELICVLSDVYEEIGKRRVH